MSKKGTKELKKKMINNIRTTIEMKNQNSAKVKIEEYLELYGTDTYIMLEKARYAKLIGNVQECINILESLVSYNPDNIGYILFELARTYKMNGMIEEAIETFKAIENTSHKNKTHAYNALGSIYMDLRMNDEAIYYFEKVLQSKDEISETAKLNLSKLYRYVEEYDKAYEMLNSIVTKNNVGLRCAVLYSKAKLFQQKNMYVEAEQILDEILVKYDANYHPAIFGKISMCLKNKKILEAQRLYKSIENIGYENNRFTIIKAEYNFVTGNLDLADKLYNSIDNREDSIVLLGLARIYVSRGDLDRAKQLYDDIINKNDKYYNDGLFHLIEIELYQKNFERALVLYKKTDINSINENNKLQYQKIKIVIEMIFNFPTVYEKSKKYSYNQLINYDLDRVVEHIENGHKNRDNSTNFYDDMDIRKLLNDIKPLLKKENIIEFPSAVKYLIHYPNIGYAGNIKLDHLIVVTELHNDNIITMYPCNQYGIDKIEQEEIEKPKQKELKRISQIDKFNKRYGLK